MKDDISQLNCPICGKSNGCESSHACWCAKEQFPKALFELVPPELRGKVCICRDCLAAFAEADARSSSR